MDFIAGSIPIYCNAFPQVNVNDHHVMFALPYECDLWFHLWQFWVTVLYLYYEIFDCQFRTVCSIMSKDENFLCLWYELTAVYGIMTVLVYLSWYFQLNFSIYAELELHLDEKCFTCLLKTRTPLLNVQVRLYYTDLNSVWLRLYCLVSI